MRNIKTDKAEALRQKSRVEEAIYDYLERGYSVLPIGIESKKPLVNWKQYQTTQPSIPDIRAWLSSYGLFNIGIITGQTSRLLVLDCDNEEAVAYAAEQFPSTGVLVRTQRGLHQYYEHPLDDLYPNRAGGAIKHATHWPRLNGLDFRGDGGYVLAPPSIKVDGEGNVLHEYEWEVSGPMAQWSAWAPPPPPLLSAEPTDDEVIVSLNLAHVTPDGPSRSIEDETAALVREIGKLPPGGGNARNERVMLYASEQILKGFWGDELRERCQKFQEKYFTQPLPEPEFAATLHSVQSMERANHPERFASDGTYIPPHTADIIPLASHEAGETTPPSDPALSVLTPDDIALIKADDTPFLIDPILREGGVVQVYGYSGHGKSMFTQCLLHHLARGESCGPFDIERPAKILYLDYENGRATLSDRIGKMVRSFGGTKNLIIVPQFSYMKDGVKHESYEIGLTTPEGLQNVQRLIDAHKPDVIVVDTIRSAFGNFDENSAPGWKPVNEFTATCRKMGLGVIMLHHGNKPSSNEDGTRRGGTEAGSTSQLNLVENQIEVLFMHPDQEEAKRRRGEHMTPDIESQLVSQLKEMVDPSLEPRLTASFKLGYGKVRDWSENHTSPMYFSLAEDQDGTQYVVASSSPKQKARALRTRGFLPRDIAQAIHRPTSVISQWVEPK